MRLNKFLAGATGISRRGADDAIASGRVTVNGQPAEVGQQIDNTDAVTLDKRAITPVVKPLAILVDKPVGYVVSRHGQGSKTIYDLLPEAYHVLKPVGRLDKDSSGLLLMTNDGDLANQLTHPRYSKTKQYIVSLNRALTPEDRQHITASGILLPDGPSKLGLQPGSYDTEWRVTMSEGRNRQIRRTFAALGYRVVTLRRTNFGPYSLAQLKGTRYMVISEH